MTISLDIDGRIDRFVAAARDYCDVIESRSATSPTDIVRIIRPRLVALYAAGLELPDARAGDGEMLAAEMPSADWTGPNEHLVEVLGAYRYYWTASGFPLAEGDDGGGAGSLLTGDLADDLADIYRDARNGLSMWEAGTPGARNDALWHWRLLFDAHFGQHLADALAATHRIGMAQ